MPLGVEVGLSPGDFVFDGDPALLPKKGAQPPPQFSAHVYCGQRAGWIKMALDTEVSLGPGHIVLDGAPAPLHQKGGTAPPQFSAHFYSARNACIASAVLAMAIPSVCPSVRPSVTRRYCVKTTAHSTVQFAPLDSKMCLVL